MNTRAGVEDGHPQAAGATQHPQLSVVTPAYNESTSLPQLYERLAGVLGPLGISWEWVVVDDNSSDATFAFLQETARRDPRVRGIRLARNFGSHTAITCGLREARGDCVAVLSADLQDSPETLPCLLGEWRAGAKVVWAVRARREGEPVESLFSGIYHFMMCRVVGIRNPPPTVSDFFLMDRRVVTAFCLFSESNINIAALITWMGFRQTCVPYTRHTRQHGQSRWTMARKIKIVVDSVTAFTYLPIRLMSYLGAGVAMTGFLYAVLVLRNALTGLPPTGWASLMVVVLILGGIQMLMNGILGEYLWRTLEESRRRPRYLIEATTEAPAEPSSLSPAWPAAP